MQMPLLNWPGSAEGEAEAQRRREVRQAIV
jgi:hypothetical protein